jgi:hypothetical protein
VGEAATKAGDDAVEWSSVKRASTARGGGEQVFCDATAYDAGYMPVDQIAGRAGYAARAVPSALCSPVCGCWNGPGICPAGALPFTSRGLVCLMR